MPLALQSTQAKPVKLAEPIDADGRQWAMLVPAGTIETKDGRGPYRLKDAEAVIAASFQHANTGSLPVDINHAIDLEGEKGRPSPASGWITRMEARADGIWGLIEWTMNAARMIREKEYRFLSPVIAHTAGKEVLAVLRASLTNNPNFTMTALQSAQEGSTMDETQLGELRTLLSLADDADGAAIVAGVRKALESRNTADPAQFVPIATFQATVAELHKLRSGISLQSAQNTVERDIEEGRLLPFMKDWAVSLMQANSAAYDDFLSGAGQPVQRFIKSLHAPTGLSRLPPASGALKVTEVHQILGHSAEDLKTYGEGAEQ